MLINVAGTALEYWYAFLCTWIQFDDDPGCGTGVRGMFLMRILIYGAGVIGSLYATLFADDGYEWL